MSKGRDRDLMVEMLRHPATVFYRDVNLVVIRPKTVASLHHFTSGHMKVSLPFGATLEDMLSELYIIHTHRDEIIVLQISDRWGAVQFRWWFHNMDARQDVRNLAMRNPSLYKAFGEIAKKVAYLPLIEVQTDKDIEQALKKSPANVAYITNLTHKRKMKIIEKYPETLRSMEQNIELCAHAIRTAGGDALRHVQESLRTQKLCQLAIQNDAQALQYVPKEMQTEAICLEAVKRDGAVLGFIRNPSINVCIAAVNKSPDAWEYIKDEKLKKKINKLRGKKRFR